MTRSQFAFSLFSGLAVSCAGFALASSQFADWGLFWVGLGITTVTLVHRFNTNSAPTPVLVKAEA